MTVLVRNLLFLAIFTSCTTDKIDNSRAVMYQEDQFPQKWELVAMSGMIANVPPLTFDDMYWQEDYILQEDGTFTKSRSQNGNVRAITGTYDIIELEDGRYLELIYEAKDEIIGTCSPEAEELLKFESGNSLIGTWWACDGPGLQYERSE